MRPLQKVRCAGDFFLGTKCVARLRYEDDAWKHRIDAYTVPEYKAHIHGSMAICFALILPLPIQGDPDRFQAVPPHIAAFMKAKKCQDCDAFAGRKAKNNGVCPHTVRWTYEGEAHRGCSYYCFHFENPDIADIPAYVDMMRGAFSLR